jgi:predicted dehydrogenase
MAPLRFGIVGTGAIAAVIADAIAQSTKAVLTAVSSRTRDKATRFVSKRPGTVAVQGADALVRRDDIDAIYIATPTVAKEAIALEALAAGKHILVDKPFTSRDSVLRMTETAAARELVFMDATHFVHHPRTAAIQAASAEAIGTPRSLHTTFYYPISDRGNIRFDAKQEPMTALGDMAWYSMRAIVEYLRPQGRIATSATVPDRDSQTGAVVRASGVVSFASGEVSTFDVGYTAGTVVMNLELLGTTGIITMDDFVLDWASSFAFKNAEAPTGYWRRAGMATRTDATYVLTPSEQAQEVRMIDTFAELAASGSATRRSAYANATLKTQEYLDAVWWASRRGE